MPPRGGTPCRDSYRRGAVRSTTCPSSCVLCFVGRGSLLTCGDVHPHPGPTHPPPRFSPAQSHAERGLLRLGTFNISSLNQHNGALSFLPCDVVLLQETRLSADAQRVMSAHLCEQGWNTWWGKPQPLVEGAITMWNAVYGGVGIVWRSPWRVTPALWDVFSDAAEAYIRRCEGLPWKRPGTKRHVAKYRVHRAVAPQRVVAGYSAASMCLRRTLSHLGSPGVPHLGEPVPTTPAAVAGVMDAWEPTRLPS